jgi:hypothetical protein
MPDDCRIEDPIDGRPVIPAAIGLPAKTDAVAGRGERLRWMRVVRH